LKIVNHALKIELISKLLKTKRIFQLSITINSTNIYEHNITVSLTK